MVLEARKSCKSHAGDHERAAGWRAFFRVCPRFSAIPLYFQHFSSRAGQKLTNTPCYREDFSGVATVRKCLLAFM